MGEVLEESAQIALSWIRAHAFELGLEQLLPAAAGVADEEEEEEEEQQRQQRRQPDFDPEAAWRGARPAGGRPAREEAPGAELLLGGGGGAAAAAPARSLRPRAQQRQGQAQAQLLASPSPALLWDIHVHLPAGAVQKDGPSAGITLAAALVSLLADRCVRPDTAMTGELTLRGLVLPVGGVREKLLAARAAGLKRVLVPARNMREVELEVPQQERAELEVVAVERLEQVLVHAFDPPYHLLPRPRM